jgi:hypothetical protein
MLLIGSDAGSVAAVLGTSVVLACLTGAVALGATGRRRLRALTVRLT